MNEFNGNFTKYKIFLFSFGPHFRGKLFSMKALLQEPNMYGEQSSLRKPLPIRSRKQRDKCLAQNYFLCPIIPITNKHSHKSLNWSFKSSNPAALPLVLKTFAAVFPDPTDSPWSAKNNEGLFACVADGHDQIRECTLSQ